MLASMQLQRIKTIRDYLAGEFKSKYDDYVKTEIEGTANALNRWAADAPEYFSGCDLPGKASKLLQEGDNFYDVLDDMIDALDFAYDVIKGGLEYGTDLFDSYGYSPYGSTSSSTEGMSPYRINSPYDAIQYLTRDGASKAQQESAKNMALAARAAGVTDIAAWYEKVTGEKLPKAKSTDGGKNKKDKDTQTDIPSHGTQNPTYGNDNYDYTPTKTTPTEHGTHSDPVEDTIEPKKDDDEQVIEIKPDEKPTDTTPTDTKPTDTKPTDTKPTQTTPTDTTPTQTTPTQTTPATEQETNTNANISSDIAGDPTPKKRYDEVSMPNTSTSNPVAEGIESANSKDASTIEGAKDSASTSVVGKTKDLFKKKSQSTTTKTLPKSTTQKTTTSSSSKGFNPVPLAVGLGAAVAGGVGIKVYKDHKENSTFDENEDSFTNGNRFWTEDDPNVINSEESTVSGDDLFNEQASSPSYTAMINDESSSNDSWSMDDQADAQPAEAFDLLG